MWIQKVTSSEELEDSVNLLTQSLPRDLLLSLLCTPRNRSIFIKSFLNSNDIYNAYSEQNLIVGTVSIGSLNELLKSFMINVHFAGLIEMVGESLKPKNFRNLISATFYFLFARQSSQEHEITWIAVQEDNRKTGVGRGLLNHLYAMYENRTDSITVKTLVRTPQNVTFYERNGFKIVSVKYGRVFLEKPKEDPKSIR